LLLWVGGGAWGEVRIVGGGGGFFFFFWGGGGGEIMEAFIEARSTAGIGVEH